jgi:hypothetical protein
MTKSPWATLMSFITPNTMESPRAIIVYKPPTKMPMMMGVANPMIVSKSTMVVIPAISASAALGYAAIGIELLISELETFIGIPIREWMTIVKMHDAGLCASRLF